MFKNKLLTALIATATLSLTAQAGISFDPEIGFSTGTQLKYTKSGTSYIFNQSGVPLGFNLTYMANNGFFVGLSANYTASGTLAASVTTYKDDTFTHTRAGLVVGTHLKNFKLAAGYDALNNMTITKNTTNTNSPDALYGSGAYAAIGYMFGPRFGVNLEYLASTFTTYDQGATKGATISTANYSNVSNGALNIMATFHFGSK